MIIPFVRVDVIPRCFFMRATVSSSPNLIALYNRWRTRTFPLSVSSSFSGIIFSLLTLFLGLCLCGLRWELYIYIMYTKKKVSATWVAKKTYQQKTTNKIKAIKYIYIHKKIQVNNMRRQLIISSCCGGLFCVGAALLLGSLVQFAVSNWAWWTLASRL